MKRRETAAELRVALTLAREQATREAQYRATVAVARRAIQALKEAERRIDRMIAGHPR